MNDKAEVVMDYAELGSIDSSLRFTRHEETHATKTGRLYHLVLAPSQWEMYGADGKTVVKEMQGPVGWQITDSRGMPWTTVNSAIRYVLEKRNSTNDATVRKNADDTLTALLQLH
jgi:hypothetical protein